MTALLRFRICFRPITLLVHQSAETVFINFETLFTCHLERQIKGESVGIVQFENFITGKNLLLARLQLRGCNIKYLGSTFKCLQEGLFLRLRDGENALLI